MHKPNARMKLRATFPARARLLCPAWKLLLVLPVAAGLAQGSRAHAQIVTSTWLGDVALGAGEWSNSLFWTLLPPSSGARVIINNGTLFPSFVTLNVDASVASLSVGPGATLAIADRHALTVTGNSTIDGTVALNGSTGATAFVASGGVITLSGSGALTLSSNSNNRIRGASATDGLVNQITIQGGGTLGGGALSLLNQGAIIANAAVPLIITPNAAGATNTGVLRATSGGTLSLESGTFTNAGGNIEAQAGSAVAISDATVTGGTVATTGTGTLRLSNATLTNVTVNNSASGVVRVLGGLNTLLGLYADAVGSQVRVENGATVALPGGTAGLTINGGIFLDSAGADTTLRISSSSFVVDGPGRLVLSDNPNNRVIGDGASAAVTLGRSFTVQGAGQLGAGLLGFTNQGSIIADRSTALVVQPSALGFANSGTLRAASGGALTLSNGTFTNTSSGTIVAGAGSHIDVSGSTIVGGNLTSVDTGHFHALASNTFTNVTLTPGTRIEVADNAALTFAGNIVNHGVVSLLSTGANADLKFDGDVIVGGTGDITLSDSPANRLTSASGGSSVTLGAGQTLSGAGQIGADSLDVTNLGTVIATGTKPLVLDSRGGSFTNHGTLRAVGPGGLTLADSNVTNQGRVEALSGSAVSVAGSFRQSDSASVTNLTNGTLAATTLHLQGGSLTGSGTIRGAVNANGGDLAIFPGGAAGIGTLAFTDSLSLGNSASLHFDVGGTVGGVGYDRINGTSVDLKGSLLLSFANGFQFSIAPSDTFTLISTSAALSGGFSGIANGSRLATLDGFGTFQVNYLSHALTISNFEAVPEPSTFALLGLGAIGLGIVRFRQRRRS